MSPERLAHQEHKEQKAQGMVYAGTQSCVFWNSEAFDEGRAEHAGNRLEVSVGRALQARPGSRDFIQEGVTEQVRGHGQIGMLGHCGADAWKGRGGRERGQLGGHYRSWVRGEENLQKGCVGENGEKGLRTQRTRRRQCYQDSVSQMLFFPNALSSPTSSLWLIRSTVPTATHNSDSPILTTL